MGERANPRIHFGKTIRTGPLSHFGLSLFSLSLSVQIPLNSPFHFTVTISFSFSSRSISLALSNINLPVDLALDGRQVVSTTSARSHTCKLSLFLSRPSK